jgi:hypothetical protein
VNQIPRAKLFAGAVRPGSGLPRDTIDAATSPQSTGRPVRHAWRNAQAAANAGRRGPGDRKTGVEPGHNRAVAHVGVGGTGSGVQGPLPSSRAHWARTSGDCAARPRDHHVRGRGQCGAGAQTPATGGPKAAATSTMPGHATTLLADESVLPLRR